MSLEAIHEVVSFWFDQHDRFTIWQIQALFTTLSPDEIQSHGYDLRPCDIAALHCILKILSSVQKNITCV